MRPSRFLTAALATTALIALSSCGGTESVGGSGSNGAAEEVDDLSIVVPADPGGGWDQTGRAMAKVMEEQGLRSGAPPLDERRNRLKEQFTQTRGYWHTFWDGLLELDPELFEAYTEFSAVPWRTGVLEPWVKELVYCAFDAAATHLYVPGLKVHMQNALRLGATPEQVMEVLEIVSVIGIHAAMEAAPVLLEEAAGRDRS